MLHSRYILRSQVCHPDNLIQMIAACRAGGWLLFRVVRVGLNMLAIIITQQELASQLVSCTYSYSYC